MNLNTGTTREDVFNVLSHFFADRVEYFAGQDSRTWIDSFREFNVGTHGFENPRRIGPKFLRQVFSYVFGQMMLRS